MEGIVRFIPITYKGLYSAAYKYALYKTKALLKFGVSLNYFDVKSFSPNGKKELVIKITLKELAFYTRPRRKDKNTIN